MRKMRPCQLALPRGAGAADCLRRNRREAIRAVAPISGSAAPGKGAEQIPVGSLIERNKDRQHVERLRELVLLACHGTARGGLNVGRPESDALKRIFQTRE
jgi:hypothetical protein